MSTDHQARVRVGVNGAGGRMGTAACEAVDADPHLELVAAVSPRHVGVETHGVTIAADLRAFADAGCDVVVDFTVASALRTTMPWLAMHGIHAVVGTSGVGDDDLAAYRTAFGVGPAHCVIAPNFAISAVLMDRLVEIAAPFFDTAEIIEYHHDRKVDAPSGTAVGTATRMAAARDGAPWTADPTEHETLTGSRGANGPSGIRIHAVRMHGMVAHQEVVLGTRAQTLTVRQDSYDRTSFMPGVVLACRRIGDHPGLTLGLDRLLGL